MVASAGGARDGGEGDLGSQRFVRSARRFTGAAFSWRRSFIALALLLCVGLGGVSAVRAQTAQTITFAALSGKTYGAAPFGVSATASSGLPVSFSSTTTAVCTVSASTVTIVAAGSCTIRASQAGNATYAPAPNVNRSFTVAKASQTITFAALAGKAMGNAPFAVSATATSGLTVSFSSTTTSKCTVSGTTVTLVAAGTCTIRAAQAGNANYLAATNVDRSFTIAKGSQTITFAALSNRNLGTAPFTVSATASSGLTVTFSSTTTAICTVSGTTVTLVAPGTCTMRAAQAGNANWLAAPNVDRSFTVNKRPQTITFNTLADRPLGSPFTVSATATSGLAVAFSSTTASVCTVSGTTVTMLIAGTCTIRAAQAGNATWVAAPNVDRSFVVGKSNQTITFGALPPRIWGSSSFNVTANASSGLPLTFLAQTTSTCAVSGTAVTLLAVGTCILQANQAGNANYNPAASNRAFAILGPPEFAIAASYPVSGSSAPISLETSDFNGDGKVDVVTAQGNRLSLFLGGGLGSFGSATGIFLGLPAHIASIHANADGYADLVVASPSQGGSTGGLSVQFGAATSSLSLGSVLGALNPSTIGVADLNNDGYNDIVVAEGADPNFPEVPGQSINIRLGGPNGSFQNIEPPTYTTGLDPQGIGIGDVNGDGKPDIIVANFGSSSLTVLLGNGTGGFPTSLTVATAAEPRALAIADFNGDGYADIAAGNNSAGTVQILLSLGNGTFLAPSDYAVPGYMSGLILADVNGDGRSDLVVVVDSTLVFLLAAGDGTFVATAPMNVVGLPNGVSAVDLNADGRIDLITGNADNTISVLMNTGALAPSATVTVNTGTPQTVLIGSAFPVPLSVLVRNASNQPLAGQEVTFAAPAAGASATFPGGVSVAQAFSNASGIATAPTLTANGTPGSFSVIASIGTASVSFLLSSIAGSNQAPAFVSSPPPDGALGLPYSFAVSATGSPPPTYSAVGNALPTGLAISSSSGLISGTPAVAGTFAGQLLASNGIVPDATQSFAITIVNPSQTITFHPLNGLTFGAPPFQIFASASSGLPVTFASTTTSVCTVSGNTVTIVGGGTCTIQASQAGNASYSPAPVVSRSFAVAKATQQITFDRLLNRQLGSGTFAVSATSSSGLAVAITSTTTSVCTIASGTVTLVALGTCTLRAAQAGNASYLAATNVNQSFTVKPAGANSPPSVTLLAPLTGATFVAPAMIPLVANPADSDGTVFKVEFYQGATLLGTATTAPFAWAWAGVAAGTYSITAKAFDDLGAAVTSAAAAIVVGSSPPALAFGQPLVSQPGLFTATLASGLMNAGTQLDLVGEGRVLTGNGNGAFTASSSLDTGFVCYPSWLGTDTHLADWNADGKLDAVLASGLGCLASFLGNGNGTATAQGEFYGSGFPVGLGSGDFNTDGKRDLVAINSDGSVDLFTGNQDGTFNAPTAVQAGVSGNAIAVGDLNGDAKPDVVVTGGSELAVWVLLGNGTGGFSSTTQLIAGTGVDYPDRVRLADLNGDGKLDILIANLYSHKITVLMGNGNGTFQPPFGYPAGAYPGKLAVADFNGDGKLDVAVANLMSTDTVSVLLGNGNGTLQVPIPIAIADPFPIVAGDFTGDGKPDLVVGSSVGLVTLINLTAGTGVAPVFTNAPPAEGLAGVPYSFPFTATGAPPPLFALNAQPGFAAGGFVLNGDGTLSSGPNGPNPGAYSAQVIASNGVAPNATQDFTIVVRKHPQTIDFPQPGIAYLNGTCFAACASTYLLANASSALPVTMISLTPSVCTVESAYLGQFGLYLHTVGTCTLRAKQIGGSWYAAAPAVDRSFQVVLRQGSIRLTAPHDNAGFVAPAAITLSAEVRAPPPGATLVRVEFLRDGVQVGTDTSEPYSVNWSGVGVGTYQVTARSRLESSGGSVVWYENSDPITVRVTAASVPISVALTGPASGTNYFAPATIPLTSTASNPGGSVTKVDFYNGAFLIGTATTAPYNFTWNTLQSGTYTLTARATSNVGVVAVSSPVTVSVVGATAAPLLAYRFDDTWTTTGLVFDGIGQLLTLRSGAVSQVSSPATGPKPDSCKAASFSGGVVDVGNVALSTTAGARLTAAFWMFWNGSSGAMPLSFATQGLLLTSAGFGFTTGGGDIYGVASTGLANGWHHVVAEFANGGVTTNRLFIDGVAQTLSQRVGTPTVGNAFVSSALRVGGRFASTANRFTGQLDDLLLFQGVISPAAQTALRTSPTPCAPSAVRLLSPITSATFAARATIELVAEVTSQSEYVGSVEFYYGTTLIATAYGSSESKELRYVWSNVAAGSYSLTAKLVGPSGVATSAPLVATVTDVGGNSSVSIAAPASGATVYADGAVHFRVDAAAAPTYQIAQVSYWANGQMIGWSSTSPYSFVWRYLVPGTYTIEVRVLDSAGFYTVGAPRTLTIIAGSPSVVYYTNDSAGSPVAATDPGGNVVWTETYAPYGERQRREGSVGNNLWYTGKPADDATGLTYLGSRWYSPSSGRFYSVDPVSFNENNSKSFNRYAYANNSPYVYADPDGRVAVPVILWWIASAAFSAYDTYQTVRSEGVAAGIQSLVIDSAVSAVAGPVFKAGASIAKATSVAEKGGLNLYKWKDLSSTKSDGWKEGDFLMWFPNKGPKANWKQNSGKLREHMSEGRPIYDSYVDPITGKQIPTTGFLQGERNILESRGWQFNNSTGAYHPPHVE